MTIADRPERSSPVQVKSAAPPRRRRWVRRLLLCTPPAFLLLAPLLHPYPRQYVFGPKINGQPLWHWQQEYRRVVVPTEYERPLLERVAKLVGVRLTHPPWFVNINVTEEEAYRILLGLVADAHPKVREAVAHDLGDIRSPHIWGRGHSPISVCWESEDWLWFLNKLEGGAEPPRPIGESWKRHEEEVVPALVRLLDDPVPEVRLSALTSLAAMGLSARRAIPRIRSFTNDPDDRFRMAAAEALWSASLDAREPTPVARKALHSVDPDVRQQAARLLGNMACWKQFDEEADVFADLVAAYRKDAEPQVRHESLRALRGYGAPALPVFLEALRSSDERERGVAALTLCRAAPRVPEALPPVRDLLRSSDAHLRHEAAAALSRIDPERYPEGGTGP